MGQRKGLCPVCVRTWAVKLAACENDLLQSGHLSSRGIENGSLRCKTSVAQCEYEPIRTLSGMGT